MGLPLMATLLVKGLIAIDDMNLGTSTFLRSTSTGGTATLTQVDFIRSTSTGTQTLSGTLTGKFQGTFSGNALGTFQGTSSVANLISQSSNPASSGFQRMAQADSLSWRNAANSGNLSLAPTPQSGNLPADTLNAPQGLSPFFLASPQSNVAAAGFIRIESANSVSWRNNANSADVALAKDTGDRMTWGGQITSAVPSGFTPVDQVAQNAAIGTTTLFAVPATGQGQYRVSWNAKVVTAAGSSSTLGALTITYTDVDGVVQTITAAAQIAAGTIATSSAGNTTTTVLLGLPITLNCKASTNIQYAFAYASNAANAMNYNLHLRLEAM